MQIDNDHAEIDEQVLNKRKKIWLAGIQIILERAEEFTKSIDEIVFKTWDMLTAGKVWQAKIQTEKISQKVAIQVNNDTENMHHVHAVKMSMMSSNILFS